VDYRRFGVMLCGIERIPTILCSVLNIERFGSGAGSPQFSRCIWCLYGLGGIGLMPARWR
jgi:hypothetical protein